MSDEFYFRSIDCIVYQVVDGKKTPIKTTILIARIKFTRSFKLWKLYLPKENSYDICKYFLNVCICELIVSNDWAIIIC